MSDMLFENEAEGIVDKILTNLRGRRGVGHELRHIDTDVYDEMVTDLIGEVNTYLEDHFEEMLGKAPEEDND